MRRKMLYDSVHGMCRVVLIDKGLGHKPRYETRVTDTETNTLLYKNEWYHRDAAFDIIPGLVDVATGYTNMDEEARQLFRWHILDILLARRT